MGGHFLLSLKMYGLVIIISLLVAALIRGVVITLSKLQKKQEPPRAARAPAAATPAPATSDPAQNDIPIIAAALYAMVGAHRIVHIQDRRGAGWTAEGRYAHHTSHAVPHKPRNR